MTRGEGGRLLLPSAGLPPAVLPSVSLAHARVVAEPPRAALVVGVLQPMSLPPSSAPTATGWSDSCRAGFAPAEEWRLSRRTRRPHYPTQGLHCAGGAGAQPMSRGRPARGWCRAWTAWCRVRRWRVRRGRRPAPRRRPGFARPVDGSATTHQPAPRRPCRAPVTALPPSCRQTDVDARRTRCRHSP